MAQKISDDWWKKSVVYQVYPRSFNDANGDGIGDLRGITQKLDYIKELGADVIWISPFFSSPNDDNGYDISDYRDIMQEFGTMQDCEELLNTAHEKGLKIMIDLVVNHSSDEHEWFKQCKTDKTANTRDYYIWRDGKNGKEPNNWFAFFGGNAWEYEKETDQYYLHMFSKKQPDLNWENPKLRREVYDIMEFWIDKGADGFRMDVINMISKEPSMPDGPELFSTGLGIPIQYVCNGPRVHEYLQEMNREVLSKHDLITVGETPNTSVTDAEKYANVNGTELNMIFQFEHMMLDKAKPGEPYRPYDLVTLKQILSKWQTELQDKAWNSLYWNNHDQPRVVSRFGNDSTPEYRVKSAKMLATCLHMMCGTPFVYQGEELGMTNAVFGNISEINDIGSINTYKQYIASGVDAKEAMRVINITTRDNARTPMQWTDGENAGFTTGKPWLKINENYKDINAKVELCDENSIYNYYRRLIALRKSNDVIVYGSYTLLLPEDKKLFAFTREYGEHSLLVVCNFTGEKTDFVLPEQFANADLLISNEAAHISGDTLHLCEYGAYVFTK